MAGTAASGDDGGDIKRRKTTAVDDIADPDGEKMSLSDDHDRRLFTPLGPEIVETIIAIKRNDPESTKLALTFNSGDDLDVLGDDRAMLRLGDIIGQSATLKELVVKDRCFRDHEQRLHLLCRGLQDNKSIEKLYFRHFYNRQIMMNGLSTFLSLNPKLREVAIESCYLGPSDIEILATSLMNRTHNTLESLSLEENDDLGDVPLDGLVQALVRNRGLTELNLGCTGIGPRACASLTVLLESPESNLTRLDLSDNSSITSESWSILRKLLWDSSSIDAVIGSNHTLCDMGLDQMGIVWKEAMGTDDADLLRASWEINRDNNKALVVRRKVLWSHALRMSPVNIGDIPSIPLGAMPSILAWLGDEQQYSFPYLGHTKPIESDMCEPFRLDSFYRILRTRPELLEDNWFAFMKRTMDEVGELRSENRDLRDENTKLHDRISSLEAMLRAADISEV